MSNFTGGHTADRLESLGVRVEGGKASILSKAPASNEAAEIRQRPSFIISGR